MNLSNSNDNFLGRWLDDKLSTEEKEQFEKSGEYQEYTSIIEGIKKLSPPVYTEDEAYLDFKRRLQRNKVPKQFQVEEDSGIRRLPVFQTLAIAASVIILLGISLFFLGNTSVTTAVAEQQKVILPDDSVVQMSGKSSLAYNPFFFYFSRNLEFEGEGFFEVAKGSTFTVDTPQGEVSVLGTRFNIKSRNDYFETTCFEGKVKVTTPSQSDILTSGKQVRYQDTDKELKTVQVGETDSPTWLAGTFTFDSTPLEAVISTLEAQFGITFDTTQLGSFQTLYYTGQFSTTHEEEALEQVFLPMGISYTKNEEGAIVLKKQKFN